MLTENEVISRIDELENQLKLCEALYKTGNIYDMNRALTAAFNVESQLDALYFVLGKKYVYKHK